MSSKVRLCAVDNCKNRMSAVDKDRHTVCQECIGYACTVKQRCFECKEWSVDQMIAFERLCKDKARKKVYRDKKLAGKSDGGNKSSAHDLSDSVDTSGDGNSGKAYDFHVDKQNVLVTEMEDDSFAKLIVPKVVHDIPEDGKDLVTLSDVSPYSPSSNIKSLPNTPNIQPQTHMDQGITKDVLDKALETMYARIDSLTNYVTSRLSSGDMPGFSQGSSRTEPRYSEQKMYNDGMLDLACLGSASGHSSRRPIMESSVAGQDSCHHQETDNSRGRKRSRNEPRYSEAIDSVSRKRSRAPSRMSGNESFSSGLGDRDDGGSFDQSMCDSLLALLSKHEHLSSEEKLRLMKGYVKENDPLNKSYVSSRSKSSEGKKNAPLSVVSPKQASVAKPSTSGFQGDDRSKQYTHNVSVSSSPNQAVPVTVKAQVHKLEDRVLSGKANVMGPATSTPKVYKLSVFHKDSIDDELKEKITRTFWVVA